MHSRPKSHPNYPRKNALEDAVYAQIKQITKREPRYESDRVVYVPAARQYSPDFTLPNGIFIETKGYFDSSDRVKHLLIQIQHPELDIRFVFKNANIKLNKNSKSTYGTWCEKHGFQYAEKLIPRDWFDETPTREGRE